MQVGAQISHYRILSRLGAGGMGEVWLARDANLGRNVAVKILHARMAEDPDWLRRFSQEARAVAALNHPNIAHVHELFEDGAVRMIVMEYVAGTTLTERVRRGALPLEEVLDIGCQVADALEEAHTKGIVHRDIKPGNIMVTDRGQVKVLDFGIAKQQREMYTGTTDTDTLGDAEQDFTRPGELRGTPRYMSREQCMGLDMDHRTDLFSLGSVLYELATGKYAYPGQTPAAVYDAILHREPDLPSTLNPALPGSFDRIILRAMERDRAKRYGSAAELRGDLKHLQQALHPSAVPKPRNSRMVLFAALVVVAACAGLWLANSKMHPPEAVNLEAVPLTTSLGTETQPSFSPDGTQVVFASNSETEDNWDIYMKLVGASASMRLTSSPATDYSPAWSPDGRSIAFLRQSDGTDSGFYLIPAFGGNEKLLTPASNLRTGVESPFLAWAPDGKTLAIADKPQDEPVSLFLLDLASGERTRLTTPPSNSFGDSGPVYSPDGRTIFFVRSHGLGLQDVYSIPTGGGEISQLTHDNRRIYGLVWNPADGRLLFASGRAGNARLWRLSPTGGEPERIVGIGENASFLALSRRGSRLAYTRSNTDTNVWRYDLKGGAAPKRIIASTRLEQGPQYSPDGGRIVFSSTRTGASEIYVCAADGSGTLRLTNFHDKPAGSPQWSPDGKMIAFDARPNGNPDIFTIAATGGEPKRLTTEASQDAVPTWSRDGKTLYFASNRSGKWEVWKIPSGGGTAEQVTHNGGFYAIESPDAKYLYFARSLDQHGLWRMPIGGGEETLVLDNLAAGYWGYWTFAPNGIYFVEQLQTPAGGPEFLLKFLDLRNNTQTKVITLDKRPFNSGLALSPDGQHVLYTQADRTDTDIMLVEGFR